MTGNILHIARREFLETARNRWFVVGTLAFPALLFILMFLPALLIRSGGSGTRCVVVDETGALFAPLKEAIQADQRLEGFELADEPPGERAVERLRAGIGTGHDAVLHLPEGIFTGEPATFYARGVSIASERLDRILTGVATRVRLAREGLDPDTIAASMQWVEVKAWQVGEGGELKERQWFAIYAVTMGFVMILYFTIAMYGVTILNSTVQEKSSRVMEVLLASTTPFHLMTGKLLGKGGAALTQLGVWTVTGFALSLSGGSFTTLRGVDFAEVVAPSVFAWFIVFFLLGFFTMASLYAAAGSTCNTPEEATQFQFPVVMPLLASLLLSFMVIFHPDRALGTALSFVPYLSPILMFVRILVRTPPLWQILAAVAINVATILATTWMAARIYRTGVLMYGKRPTIPELLRWVRAS
ncbi:MAG TPA: ABC transporter permease [Candidatus Polarisedimenticolia bacterium]|nr:ABC transporter permease [Candidatus Polarisedimenticolia bacterium]